MPACLLPRKQPATPLFDTSSSMWPRKRTTSRRNRRARPPSLTTPHHSWERGTNENTNGLIRKYLPKLTSRAHVTQDDCGRIAAKLNSRPRKRLGYKTPEECYVQAG